MKNIVLIACSGTKLSEGTQAGYLYTGELFKLSKTWANSCLGGIHEWMILSAKHGLVHPLEYLSPYDLTLDEAQYRREWSAKVREQLESRYKGRSKSELTRFIILAGNNYCGWAYPPLDWAMTARPLQGLGIGQQKAALGRMISSLEADKHAWPHVNLQQRIDRSLVYAPLPHAEVKP